METLNLHNPVFATYAIAATLMILKGVAMSWLTVVRMMQEKGGFRAPEDTRKTLFNPEPNAAQTSPNERVERVRRIQQNDRVEWVAVGGERLRNEAEVEWERHTCRQDAVESIDAQISVELQLVARPTGRFDDDHEVAATVHRQVGRQTHGAVKPFNTFVKSHVFWTMPEQLFEPVDPGHPPLSRWIAHIEMTLIPLAWAKVSNCWASWTLVDSVLRG